MLFGRGLKLFSGSERHARLAVTERSVACQFAATKMQLVHFLVKRKLHWFELSADMRAVAEWLLLAHATSAPVVVFRSKHYIFNFIGSNLRRHRERELSIFCLKSAFLHFLRILLDGYVWQRSQVL